MTFACHHVRPGKPKSRTGLTLTELMVSVTIMIVLVAAAVPILRPLNASSKNREAARQIQALFAEARALAAYRGRPVGVMFDTSLDPKRALDVQDRDAVTRLYLAEVPPTFQGTSSSSCVVVSSPLLLPANDPDVVGQAYNRIEASPPVPPQVSSENPFAYLSFYDSPATYYGVMSQMAGYDVDRSVESLIAMQTSFRIRFNGAGPWFEATRDAGGRQVLCSNGTLSGLAPVPGRFRIQAVGLAMLKGPLDQTFLSSTVNTSLYLQAGVGGRPYAIGSGIRPPLDQPLKYQIQLPPQRVGTSALELPSGAVIDMRCSGFGRFEYALCQPLLPAQENPVLLFAPNGSIDTFVGTKPTDALHLLVGTRKQMATLTVPALQADGTRVDKTDPDNIYTLDSAFGNLRDGSSVWVTINNRTGAVATSDIGVIPKGFPLGGTRQFDAGGNPINAELVRREAIRDARVFANSLNSKGGL